MKMITSLRSSQGLAALMTVFIAGIVIVAVAAALALRSVGNLGVSLAMRDAALAFSAAEACADEGLVRLVRDAAFSGTSFAIGVASCSVGVSGTGAVRTLTARGIAGEATRSITLDFDTGTKRILRWQEPIL